MSTDFITQRHAAYQTPQPLIFDLIQQATGDEPTYQEKLVRGYDNEVYAIQTRQGHDYIEVAIVIATIREMLQHDQS
jgi:hypothetical protein